MLLMAKLLLASIPKLQSQVILEYRVNQAEQELVVKVAVASMLKNVPRLVVELAFLRSV